MTKDLRIVPVEELEKLVYWNGGTFSQNTQVIAWEKLREFLNSCQQVSGEPVAWLFKGDQWDDSFVRKEKPVEINSYWTPLFPHPAVVTDGYKLVPIEPTEGMLIKAREITGVGSNAAYHIYKAMITDSPIPQADEKEVERKKYKCKSCNIEWDDFNPECPNPLCESRKV